MLQPVPLTPEETAAAEARAKKKFEVLFVFATVYDRSITELRWWFENHEYRAWSNVDFNFLAGQGEIEIDDSVYTVLMALANESAESATAEGKGQKQLPSPVRFDPAHAQ